MASILKRARNPIIIILTTLIDAFLVAWLASYPAHSQSTFGATVQGLENQQTKQCTILDSGGAACKSTDSALRDPELVREFIEKNLVEEEDPMLETMPGLGFKAYRRADISTMYQEEPGSRIERKPKFGGQAGKFVNMSPVRLDLYWDGDQGLPGTFISSAGPFESTGTSSFPTHIFHFIRPKTNEVACTFNVKKGTSVYYCNPFIEGDASDASAGVRSDDVLSLTVLTEKERELYSAAQFNREFAPLYKNFTGGSEWLGNFPTEPPRHHIWRADVFGQEHQIQTRETHFVELPPEELLDRLSNNANSMRRHNTTTPPSLHEYRAPGLMNITIKTVSVSPRIFQIDGFLSDVEVDHLLDLAVKKHTLIRSTTGHGVDTSSVSTVRTSRTAWLPRFDSPIMDAIIRRGADVLKIDEAMFRHRERDEMPEYPDTKSPINEDLQLVHYSQGQEYTAHHDFGYPDTRPNAPSRSINLCMYLNEGMVGGETAFPRWRNAETDDAVKAVPQKGKAMIFYMKTPDGNLDDLSQHAAMPVIEGEKWFANLWSWDPVRG